MSKVNDPDANLTTEQRISRAVRKLEKLPFEDRLQLFVTAKLMTQAEADEILARKRGEKAQAGEIEIPAEG